MAKIHLVQSQIPLTEGKDVEVMCGKIIGKAAFVAFVDSDSDIPTPQFGIAVCARCQVANWFYRYLYAVREGQDEHQSIT